VVQKDGHVLKVLIVDDSPLIRERLKRMLSELEQVEIVGTAEDGDEALRLFEEIQPAFVLLDLEIPRRNGLEVLREIRRRAKPCVVVMLTNYDLPDLRNACLCAGADFFLRKSTEFERVVEIVRTLVQRRRRPSSCLELNAEFFGPHDTNVMSPSIQALTSGVPVA
jgi:DNA-binding NarL/FixJ family response regulator